MRLNPQQLEALLDSWPVARLASRDERNTIYLVPMVFVRLEGTLWSPVDGKPKSGAVLQRIRNIRNNPGVTLLLDEYDQDWSKLWWIKIDGKAEIITEEINARPMAEVAAALQDKYPQYRSVPMWQDPPTLIRIEPIKIASWCADPSALP